MTEGTRQYIAIAEAVASLKEEQGKQHQVLEVILPQLNNLTNKYDHLATQNPHKDQEEVNSQHQGTRNQPNQGSEGSTYIQQHDEESAGDELVVEPHLILHLRSEVDVEGDTTNYLFKSRHGFNDCTSSFLNSFIKENEPLPMEAMMNPEVSEMVRQRISDEIAYLVQCCIGVAGLKMLQVDVISTLYEEVEDELDILRESRMALMQKNVRLGDGMGTSSSTSSMEDTEVCSVCLEEMVAGGKEVVCTPCGHQFHAHCVGKWFEKSSLCPLCRFNFGP